VALTTADPDAIETLTDPHHPGPDTEFDRAWACAVLRQALDQLEAEMTKQNRLPIFQALKPWLSGEASHGDTSRTAQHLNTTETAVRVHLSRLRKRLRSHIESTVNASLAPGADSQEELATLLNAFR
jgi:hypothetical protein